QRVDPVRKTGKDFPLARDARLSLPDAPGVYRMLGKNGEVLYLGKATSLKRRVNSHFTSHGNKELLTQAWHVDVAVTGSALEAAVREADEIKEHAPPYNVALRGKQAVWFASRDWQSVCARPDEDHACGPLPERDALAALVALSAPPDCEDAPAWERALGMRVDAEQLQDGLALFREKHGACSPHDLVRLGARLWHAPEPERSDDELPRAERVAALMESSVRRSAHLRRRARWLARLSEATLEWRGRDAARRLTVARGRVGEEPPDFARASLARLASFDPATYDRLRVLTTELRRLVAERRDVTLRIGPRLRLDPARLARRLAWV
ncbi:MAG: nucleotide excision repair endonuclease, partial [Planctomycetota bacterium]|nr:nucleotide excision repair endonuclease [Planctomycetota bacterium]